MSIFKKLCITGSVTVMAVAAMFLGLGGNAFADCTFIYNANGFTTSATPVFNNICGVPDGIGDEANFVRIRPDVTGDDTDNTNNPTYTIGTLTSQCTSGSKFDIYNYLHNDAYSQDNDNGSGSAVATGVKSDMYVQEVSGSEYQFNDTVSATNASPSSVSDDAVLDCDGNAVSLSLVPGTVHIYSIPYGNNWENLANSSVNMPGATNTPIPLGSPILGSGIMWGCWNYRIAVVYQVEVTSAPSPTPTPTPTPSPTPTPTPTPTSTPPVTTTAQVTSMPNTGAGTIGTIAAFIAAAAASAYGFRRYTIRKLNTTK